MNSMMFVKRGVTVKKHIVFPLLAYIIVCIIAVLIPSSDEAYNVLSWKLFVGQIYAIPVLLIAALISYFLYKKSSSSQ